MVQPLRETLIISSEVRDPLPHMISHTRIPVILFRAPINPSSSDPYHLTFQQHGYEATSVPVLTETFRTDELRRILERGCQGYDGVVIMSRRGAEGWVRAATAISGASEGLEAPSSTRASKTPDGGEPHDCDPCSSQDIAAPLHWSTIPLFTVGSSARDTSARAVISSNLKLDTSNQSLTAKSATALIPILLQNHSARSFLIIRGDRSLDEIPAALVSAGRKVRETTLYETIEHPELGRRVSAITEGLPNGAIWMTFFSPSSAGMALSYLRRLGMLSSTDGSGGLRERVRIAAIGETTRRFLEDQGVEVDAVAEEPNAEGLVEAIRRAGE